MTEGSSAPQTWRLIDLIRWGTQYLANKQISNPRLEVEWLLAHQLGVNRVDLYVSHDRQLTRNELDGFKALIKRRIAGEPFQYILGKAPFYGRDFHVTPAVLIPRPESEILIQVLRKGDPPTTILDIGTGSGCLAITAALLYPAARVLAIDISPEALDIAQGNAERLGAENVTFQQFDVLVDAPSPLDAAQSEGFDAILCNPPYVAAEEVARLQREIREYEPPLAVTDRADGLTFHRRLAHIGSRLLAEEGQLIVEIGGMPQADSVKRIFEQAGYTVTLHKDLQGDERVISVQRR
ncbi:MAG: peptide chain release factor N(5)-glutamine methyltransferase [Fidelibacterota bacterium]|nr:MAG: peptide chain release factor N(5)-glutamine methyltransferase [Candidatus Neomarinimicrobiota bacterium]